MIDERDDLIIQIAALQEEMKTPSSVKSYKKDSGEGMQQVSRRSLSEIMKALRISRNQKRWLDEQLCGLGTPVNRLRRRALANSYPRDGY